ncbi:MULTISPECIES: molybdopterin molybdotransferase MoeA [unclassified Tolypothrix]|uniref:molybdopterin molybdotransferase MoeA n=1 Tax=unclassified Tolypothrix TaxID=2649714 RepID=UPI0005EAC5EA|nr:MULTISPECIES: gephyrin-like molybdotransferase Glp [unclassified Tolypothrix]BAY88200.1 molybdenum cofactor synthesis domain-containing protein [Microchaete diplosiphon NIES-3275]EKF02067.1 molybdenum cofactor synthesis domain protein [Tolypothrix sp. PCC 7601]MBE9086771.1 molybdopterin molybdotransferase MoeA [Tolypothrix sp. LEGE 11397]UYD28902.1 molybdopterin molybdotransferase MoeA [Tolypothrix sp. PCC 7712]UYD35185.1 molybdopterin molybdotransferase MoeA [Tolypothrix sp. PCC 7601]
MLSVSDTEAVILNLVQPLDAQGNTENVDLLAAAGRILATPVTSQLDFPHWDNSAMDGYAVRYEDVQHSNPEQPVVLEIVEEIPAGYQPQYTILQGQAARIFTGAIIPQGADTVVIQEVTNRQDKQVEILSAPKPQEFVRHKGEFYQAGTQLLPSGILLTPAEIAVLAAAQCAQVSVYRRPRVAIFSTGDELVTLEQSLKAGQIVDSNGYALAALVKQAGAEALMLGIVKDDPVALEKTIAYAIANADIVISSGGVSVGDYDYVDKILESLGAEIHIRAVAMRPGKPLTVASFSTQNSALYFGLPGNPAAVLVTFLRFVQPAIKKLSGLSAGWQVKFVNVRSHQELRSDGKRETYIWGQLQLIDGVYEFRKAGGSHSSGNLINLAQTNALAVIPVATTLIPPGDEVLVLLTL